MQDSEGHDERLTTAKRWRSVRGRSGGWSSGCAARCRGSNPATCPLAGHGELKILSAVRSPVSINTAASSVRTYRGHLPGTERSPSFQSPPHRGDRCDEKNLSERCLA